VIINNTTVFVCTPHDAVAAGEIALNSLQRTSCKVSSGEPASVAAWTPPANCKMLILRLEVDVIGKRMADLKEVELSDFLLSHNASQPMTKGQTLCADFQGVPLKMTVTSVEQGADDESATEGGSVVKFGKVGIIGGDTDIMCAAPKNSKRLKIAEAKTARRSPLFNPGWSFSDMGIGGLDAEFGQIFRRSFASRMFPPELIAKLGINHVKGMLLHGPPGTGKTLIARQIGKMLAGKEPKIVNGPEILNKFVGASEENIRKLFEDAEKDQVRPGFFLSFSFTYACIHPHI
jgi:vesicle-fusing ATPase